jgi:ATP-dependent Lon protease
MTRNQQTRLASARNRCEYLGKPRFHFEAALRTEKAGVATGLAVTPVGGDVLFIEAACMPGKDRLTLTGNWATL